MFPKSSFSFGWTPFVGIALVATILFPASVRAQIKYNPDDYEVEEIVWRGVDFIERSTYRDLGGVCLHALAICEAYKRYERRIPLEIQRVQDGIVMADQFTLTENGETTDFQRLYDACIASILLGVVDKERYRPNIEALLRHLEMRQMPSGAWQYKLEETATLRLMGDTSQTQYACLALWAAANCDIYGDPEVCRRALQWLIATQKPSGGWVYRAQEGGRNDGDESLSIASAGAGGVYMMLEILGADGSSGPRRAKRAGPDFPDFITVYDPEAERLAAERAASRPQTNIDQEAVRRCVTAANQFFGQRFQPDPPDWQFYFLYGFERYAFFREQADGQVFEIPDWYDRGVEYLKSTQEPDGSWTSIGGKEGIVNDSVKTAFAILFLVRSTELLAGDRASGVMHGGASIPRGNAELVGGKVVGETIVYDVDAILEQIASGETDLERYRDSLAQIVLPADPAQREHQSRILRALVTDQDAYKRLIAVKALSSVRDLNNVPALILAMKDTEDEIKWAAHVGLRFISRKIDSIQLPENPEEGDFLTARRQWIDWYKSIRPEDRQVTE